MKKLIVFNHKIYLDNKNTNLYIEKIKEYHNENLIICPDFIELESFLNANLNVGTQNFSYTNQEADTGELSLSKLYDLGVKNYIIGHSERVKHHGEKLNIINKKVKLVEEKGAKAIVCVGDKKDNIFSEFLIVYQLKKIFKNIVTDNIVIAYEPVYSIGTGKILSRGKIEKRIRVIKKYFLDKKQKEVKVLYGGSVDENSIKELSVSSNIDGFLIGKASADINKAIKLLEVVK